MTINHLTAGSGWPPGGRKDINEAIKTLLKCQEMGIRLFIINNVKRIIILLKKKQREEKIERVTRCQR